MKTDIARRKFMGTLAAALVYAGIGPLPLSGHGRARLASVAAKGGPDPKKPEDYDKLIKLANNDNPYGPPEGAVKAMNDAWKYGNRYAARDGRIVDPIA